ncbi:MAG: response regulator transcription factor [Lachnospiraceae bacterium]|nr:response regulator transcription factor [Lachnospiraceae bacterium]
MKLLLIEDNASIIHGLAYSFQSNNYDFIHATNVKDAKELLGKEKDIDVIVLDVTLPDGNGFQLYKEVIKELNIPTIFLTAKDDEDDIVNGFEIGADDYVTKPFSTKELIARVNRIIMRNSKDSTIKIKDVEYDAEKMIVYKEGKVVELTPLELKLVNLLFLNIGKVVSRNTLIDKIWEWTGNDVYDHSITVYLNRIRDKIGKDVIITVKGVGYRIDE